MYWNLCLVLLCLHQQLCHCISLDQLFPYGLQFGDSPLLQGEGMEDASSTEVHLSVPLKYFQREYLSLFVNENGLVSFLTEISTFYSVQFPMDYPVIAPFYADIDTRGGGQVYWRASTQAEDLTRAANLVARYNEHGMTWINKLMLCCQVLWQGRGLCAGGGRGGLLGHRGLL